MSHDLLVSNRPSSMSDSNHSSNSNQSNHCNDPLIGQQFASSILLADLAIQSTAYIPSTSDAALDGNTKKAKRRVTFKDDIQIQMIPVYSSCSSASSSSEDLIIPPEEPVKPTIASSSSSERISKKAAYDALQYRKQVRRRDNNNTHPSSKSGFWYPLNPPTKTTTNNGMARHSSHPLPALRSLEMTERLISESIEREMALYPNLRQQEKENEEILSSPLPPPPSPPRMENNTTSILIIDSDDEEEEEEEYNTSEYFTTHEDEAEDIIYQTGRDEESYESSVEEEEEDDQYQNRLEIAELEKTPSLENDDRQATTQHSIMQHSANSMYIEDSDTSVTTSSPSPNGFEEKFQAEDVISSFEKYSPPELTLPFEKKFISISTKSNSSSHHHIPPFIHPVHHLFFIKVLKAEHLDFPVENDNTNIYCSIRYKENETRSQHQQLAHTMNINHEMRIVDVDPDQQIALTFHVERGKKSNPWYHKIKSSSDLERYVHEKDGSICQTLFSPDRFMNEPSLEQTASLMLVNGWYRILLNNNSSSSLLSFKKKKSGAPAALAREKAVGKVVVKCLCVEAYGDRLPETMDEAIQGINANRFHQTVWQSGYLSQCGGDETEFTRRYFTLTGGILCAFTNDRIALHQISLSHVIKLACNTHIIAERPTHYHTMKTPTTLLSQLEQVIMTRDDDDSSLQEENGFQLYLDDGDIIQFHCESLEERNKWVSIMEVMICKLPVLPDWIKP